MKKLIIKATIVGFLMFGAFSIQNLVADNYQSVNLVSMDYGQEKPKETKKTDKHSKKDGKTMSCDKKKASRCCSKAQQAQCASDKKKESKKSDKDKK